MRSLTKIILWVLGVVIIAVGAYYFLMSIGRRSEVAGPVLQTRQPAADSTLPRTMPKNHPAVGPQVFKKPEGHSSSTVTPSRQPQKTKNTAGAYGTLPTSPPSPVSTSPRPKKTVPYIVERREKLRKIQSRLLNMIRKNHAVIDVKQLDAVLAELSQFKDKNGLVGGVDIKALRQNLVVTGEIQKLSRQIQREGKRPPGQVDMTRLQADIRQLQELQKKLLPANYYMAPAAGK